MSRSLQACQRGDGIVGAVQRGQHGTDAGGEPPAQQRLAETGGQEHASPIGSNTVNSASSSTGMLSSRAAFFFNGTSRLPRLADKPRRLGPLHDERQVEQFLARGGPEHATADRRVDHAVGARRLLKDFAAAKSMPRLSSVRAV